MNKSYPFLSMCTAKASAATPRITVGCAHMACGLNSHLIYVYDSNKLHESSGTSSGGKNPLNCESQKRLNLSHLSFKFEYNL